jgi:hypothetical protein
MRQEYLGTDNFPELPPFKIGDTFLLGCIKKDSSGVPENLTGVLIRSMIRSMAGELVQELTVVKGDQTSSPGTFTLSAAPVDTMDWPSEFCHMDIKFFIDGQIVSSQTVVLPVETGETHD